MANPPLGGVGDKWPKKWGSGTKPVNYSETTSESVRPATGGGVETTFGNGLTRAEYSKRKPPKREGSRAKLCLVLRNLCHPFGVKTEIVSLLKK